MIGRTGRSTDGEPADREEGQRPPDSFLAVTNPASHPAFLATYLATTFSAATTGHAFSSTGVDVSTVRAVPHPTAKHENYKW
jgi:hypothetical protein